MPYIEFSYNNSYQKSYIDIRRRDLEFHVDEWVYLKVSPMKDVITFYNKGKLSPRYLSPTRYKKRLVIWLMSWSYHQV